MFSDPRLAKAVVDRLTHRAHVIVTGNESWRFRHGLKRNTGGSRKDARARSTASGKINQTSTTDASGATSKASKWG